MAADEETGTTGEDGWGTGRSVRLENVTKTFGDGTIIAAENIDLTIQPDEFVVLLGPSGCGKTTTLRCISGLEIPDSGAVYIGDREVTNSKPKDRNLAFVFQTIALFPHMNVRKNIRFGLDMKTDLSAAEKEVRVEEAAELLGIAGLLDRKPSDLSGGQQQRVSLGRAMVMEPDAFLLDEPFSALDANLRDQMRTEIKQLHRRLQTAMIFVTHDQAEAMTLGDKIVVMQDGLVQQIAAPYEIYNEPANQFVAQFIGSPSANLIESTVEAGESVTLVNDLFELELTANQTTEIDTNEGQTVTLGVRPEYLTFGSDKPLFNANIALVEPEGARDVVFLESDGYKLRATTDQGKTQEATSTGVMFDPEDIWVFDNAGERIL